MQWNVNRYFFVLCLAVIRLIQTMLLVFFKPSILERNLRAKERVRENQKEEVRYALVSFSLAECFATHFGLLLKAARGRKFVCLEEKRGGGTRMHSLSG